MLCVWEDKQLNNSFNLTVIGQGRRYTDQKMEHECFVQICFLVPGAKYTDATGMTIWRQFSDADF